MPISTIAVGSVGREHESRSRAKLPCAINVLSLPPMLSSRIGSKRGGFVVQERDKHLLRELSLMRVIDREQARIVAGFRSMMVTNRRLLLLTRAGLLKRFFIGTVAGGKKGLYSLSPL